MGENGFVGGCASIYLCDLGRQVDEIIQVVCIICILSVYP